MHMIRLDYSIATELEAILFLQLYLKYYKNGRILNHKNGSLDRFSAGLATNKQDVSWFMKYSFQTGFRPCLYEDIRPRMRSCQLRAGERFIFENFYSCLIMSR